jgi:integrase
MIADGSIVGLYLKVGASGKSWIFKFSSPSGKRREMGLGSINDVSLAAARKAAQEARQDVRAGIDPIEQRKAQAPAPAPVSKTFTTAAAAFIEAHEAGWRNAKHAAQWKSTLATYAGTLGNVATIKPADVVACLAPIWQAKPETARRVRSRIENVLDYARVMGWREGDNPARLKGNLEYALPGKRPAQEHFSSMPYADLPAFWQVLQAAPGMGSRALQFAILCASRSGEVRFAKWDEIDGDVWTIPADRMKAGKAHVVPLSSAALELLASLPRTSKWIFGNAAGNPLSDMTLAAVLKRQGLEFTVHGFRSSWRNWCATIGNVPDRVI